ncbi:glycosyltransferase [Chondromyces apiculatus]|uniref:TPR/glycosyl transferase domain protein n=1 Tax=Chondromyces apiculatus DSM 436 TaxID=1192034 RepID=A0A017T8H1_9BACT|nr:glycosyltransferase [Chondromyces apiculatus]EYF04911.1 TPR/glycosyl transferase domain protein [Chondromyces apiculatus DSM 436]
MRPFLLISPGFAPQAAVGVYRWVKIARHLPRHGFRPVVLAATFPDDRRDPALLDALPPEVEVVEDYLSPRLLALRSRRLGPPSTALPERQLGGHRPFRDLGDRCVPHAPHAAAAAVRLARRVGAEAVVVSAGPFSAIPVGLHVKRALGLPLILDFRDPWSLHESGDDPDLPLADRARRVIVSALERRFLTRADHLVLNTRRTLEAYSARYPELAERFSFIRNCFDLDLYTHRPETPRRARPSRPFTLLHLGTLRADTAIDDIVAALRRLIDTERLVPGDLVLRQVGRMSAVERDTFDALGLTPFVEVVPPIPQRDVLSELLGAHVLLAMVTAGVTLRINAKLYDYLASGMPILSISANPEVDALLAHRPDNARLLPGDIEGITRALAGHLARHRATGALPDPVSPPAEHSADAAAARMASILERVTARAKPLP